MTLLAAFWSTFGTVSASVASILIGALALVVSRAALNRNQDFRKRDELSALLTRFDASHLHVRIWRMEQLTRRGGKPWDIKPRTIDDYKQAIGADTHRLAVFNDALATDWSSERVDMQALYFFAIAMRAWLPAHPSEDDAAQGARRINETFGYQLFSTFLDQRITACRLLPNPNHEGIEEAERPSYYASNYGLYDPRYNELVEWLAQDVFRRSDELPPRVNERFRKKHAAVREHVGVLGPLPPRTFESAASRQGQES